MSDTVETIVVAILVGVVLVSLIFWGYSETQANQESKLERVKVCKTIEDNSAKALCIAVS